MREWGLAKSIVMLLIASAFAIAGALMWLHAKTEHDRLMALGAFAFFGSCIPFSLIKLYEAAMHRRGGVLDRPEMIRVFGRSTYEVAAMTFMSIGLGIGCYLLLRMDPAKESVRLAAWVGVAMFGFGGLAMPIMMVLRPVRLVLSPQGLDYTHFKVGFIEWRDIIGVSVRQFMKSDVVSLEVADPEKYFARGFPKRGRTARWLSGAFSSPFVFVPSQVGAATEAVIEAIKLRLSFFGGPRPVPASTPAYLERREPRL